MLCVELVVKASEIVLSPSCSELEAMVHRLVTAIVESAERLPRVEHVLFPDLKGFELVIPSVRLQERVVGAAREDTMRLLKANTIGPQR